MLVPVLALGVMGCGSTVLISDDTSVPAALVGAYNSSVAGAQMTLQGTQAALIKDAGTGEIGNIVFSIEWTAGYGEFDALTGTTTDILFKRGDDGKDIATITVGISGTVTTPILTIENRDIHFNYMTHMIPNIDDVYTRIGE